MKNMENTFIDKIKKLIPNENDRCKMLVHSYGIVGVLSDFIIHEYKNQMDNLPLDIKYTLALATSQIISIICDDKIDDIVDLSGDEYVMNEYDQENVYRKTKFIVEEMCKYIQENEKI